MQIKLFETGISNMLINKIHMSPLIIPEGSSTPKVVFDKDNNKFELSGNSLPEDVMSFYAPLYKWLEDYSEQPNKKTEAHFNFSYFNSSSAKVILEILAIFEKIASKGFEVEIFWCYSEMDEDMLSTGKEYESMLAIPFTFISSI